MMSTAVVSDNDFDYDEDGVYIGTIVTLQADEVTIKERMDDDHEDKTM